MTYNFSESSRMIKNGKKVILGNKQTGQWMRISKEVYDILNLGIDNNISIEELKLNLYDNEDREYIDNLYKKLCYMSIINNKNNNTIFRNKIASFEMTHRCNLKCIHCCIDADDIITDKKDLTTEETKKVLDKLIDWNPQRIMLSGGEPMLRNDFIELLTYLHKNYNGEITVSTNGTLINKTNVETLARCAHQIDISLDGVDEETCSIVRGSGVFDRVINNVKLLQSTGFKRIVLSMATSDKNEHLKRKFNELNQALGTRPLIRTFSAVGRGKDNKEYFSDTKENEVYIPKEFLSDDYTKNIGLCSCNAGKREVFIAYNGDLYPCPSFIKQGYFMGNILSSKSLSTISDEFEENIGSYDLLKNYNVSQYEKCRNCKVNLFCWTCPGELEELKDNKLAIEDRCKKIKPILYKRLWEG